MPTDRLHPLNEWVYTADGENLDRDLFSTEIWRRFQFSIFNPEVTDCIRDGYDTESNADEAVDLLQRYFEKHIERGRRFVWSLTVPANKSTTEYVVFGGDCFATPN